MESSVIKDMASEFNRSGFSTKDSLHLACAIDSGAACFITVDKDIIKKRDMVSGIKILNPLEFISMEDEI